MPAADIAGEDNRSLVATLTQGELDHRRSQNVTGVVEAGGDAVGDIGLNPVIDLPRKAAQRGLGIGHCVKWPLGITAAATFMAVAAALEVSIFFLYFGRVEQHHLGDVGGGVGAVDVALEALNANFRDKPGVVQVGVGQQDGIEAGGGYAERFPVPVDEFTFLKEAAVDEDAGAVHFQQVARAGDVPGGAQEGKLDIHEPSLRI